MAEPRILILDIEYAPTTAYVWKAWDENVNEDQIIEDGGIICVGYKFLGDKKCHVPDVWSMGPKNMLQEVADRIEEADAIVTYNGDRYDLPKLEGEFILHGIGLPPKTASIDLIKTVKKLKYFRSSLKYVSRLLDLGGKLEHEGFMFWRRAIEGDSKAQSKMIKYCEQDVHLAEKLYLRLLPAIRNHPNLHGVGCPSCGSKHSQSRGYRLTRLFKIQRLQCQSCSHWFDGQRSKL